MVQTHSISLTKPFQIKSLAPAPKTQHSTPSNTNQLPHPKQKVPPSQEPHPPSQTRPYADTLIQKIQPQRNL